MKRMRWVRILALCLSMVCLVAAVGAADLVWDLDKDGKTDVWDLQQAVNAGESEENLAAALKEALGGNGDELHENAEGVWEIYSPLGLYNMAKMAAENNTAGETFVLKADINMEGYNWTPTASFMGTFDGDGHKICNVNITKAVAGSSFYNQGFFSKIGKGAVVRDLKLEKVTVDASALPSDKNNFIGLLTGSLTGTVQDCTTTGTVIDSRTTLTTKAYIGTLVGRIEDVTTYEVPGIVLTENYTPLHAEDDEKLLAALDEALTIRSATISGESKEDAADVQTIKNNLRSAIGTEGQPVISKMAMRYGMLGTDSAERQTGIVGWASTDAQRMEGHNWQDISSSIDLMDPVLAERRQAVVDGMYDICTVQWSPDKKLTTYYYKTTSSEKLENTNVLSYTTKVWSKGGNYRGMPYNHGSGSLERFNAWVNNPDLPDNAYYYTFSEILTLMSNYSDPELETALSYTYTNPDTEKTSTYDLLKGFKTTSSTGDDTDKIIEGMTVGETVRSADHAGFSRYIGNDCSSAIQWAWRSIISSDVANGGTVAPAVTQMVPTATYQTRYGVQPVNGLEPRSKVKKTDGTWETNAEWWENNYTELGGQDAYTEAYAKASRGDALVAFNSAGGHSRMIAYDPICIRDYAGDIDVDNSYIITHEQGRNSYENGWTSSNGKWSSSCYANCLYTFDQLSEYDKKDAEGKACYTTGTWGLGSSGHYMPMTLPAFHTVNTAAVSSTVGVSGTTIMSNFYIVSTTVDGNEVFTAVGQHKTTDDTYYVGSGYRDAQVQVDVAAAHGDVTGKTVTVLLSNGDTYTVDMTTGTAAKN